MSKATKLTTLIATIVLVIYDIYAYTKGGTENTISVLIWDKSLKYPMLPFGFGVLCGHFFWQNRRD